LKANVRRTSGCILVFLLSIVLGFLIGRSIVYFMNEGIFVSWEAFSAPTKFARILQASSTKIWVQADDDLIYEGSILCQGEDDCQQWQVVEQAPADLPLPEWPMKRSPECEFNEFSFMKTLPGESIECVEAYFGGYDGSTTVYYALLKDGSIAIWKNSSSNFDALIIPFFCMVISSIATCIFGIIYWITRRPRSLMKQTEAG
jgi:hypothetical protein